LAFLYIEFVHVELTEANKDRLLKVSGQLDASVSAIVNGLLSSIDTLEIEREVRLRLKKPDGFEKESVAVTKRFVRF
jgi:hypothetical protein